MSANITMPGVALKEETYRGFLISWQEPPMMGRWSTNVASNNPNLFALMKQAGSKVIGDHDRDAMLSAAKAYVDSLLG